MESDETSPAFEDTFMADDFRVPNQEELEKELSEYLSKKYGYRIKVISPMMMSQAKESTDSPSEPTGVDKIRFDLKPEELAAYLDRYVVKQDGAKAVLATKICTHYHRIRFEKKRGRAEEGSMVGRIKNNILLVGPTGVGKTYLVKLIARKLGVPFVKGDATKFSETGYVGGDVEDLVRELLVEAKEDIELAQHGIIYVDEIDKIASSHSLIGPDVSRTGVQRALLKPMEETEVDLKVAHDPISQLQAIEQYRKTGKRERRVVNTKNILFIMSGAFNELAPLVKKRLQKQEIGFGAEIPSKGDDYRYMKHVKAEDLIAYGFESEFVGRLPVVAVLDPLGVEDLYEVLRNPNNPILLAKKEDFRSYGIDIRFEDGALRLLARMGYEEKTGARGLVSVIERVLLPFEKSLPSSSVKTLAVTEHLVIHPEEELEGILTNPEDPDRLAVYRAILEEEKSRVRVQLGQEHRHYPEDYPLIFTESRMEIALEHHIRSDWSIESVLDEVMLLYNQVRVFEGDFCDTHGFQISFDEEAVDEIIQEALNTGASAAGICARISRDYDYGFKLVSERSGQLRFVLPKEAVLQPDQYLDDLIRDSYRQYPITLADRQQESQN